MNQQHRVLTLVAVALAMFALPGCELVEGVFKVGMWTALVLAGLVILAIFAATRLFRSRASRRTVP